MQDVELKRLGESISRKEVAMNDAEGHIETVFDLEISTLKDKFETRCMLLLNTALALNDPMAIQHYFQMIDAAACESMRPQIYASLYKNLVRHVLFELDDRSKLNAIDIMELYYMS